VPGFTNYRRRRHRRLRIMPFPVALRFIKHDGFRTLIAIEEGTVRAFTRNVY